MIDFCPLQKLFFYRFTKFPWFQTPHSPFFLLGLTFSKFNFPKFSPKSLCGTFIHFWYKMPAKVDLIYYRTSHLHHCHVCYCCVVLCCCLTCSPRGDDTSEVKWWMCFLPKPSLTAVPVGFHFLSDVLTWNRLHKLGRSEVPAPLCHRWWVQPMGSWTQTTRLIPTLRLQLRQRRWSMRPSRCHTAASPLLHVHLSLPLFSSLPLSLWVSLLPPFAMQWNCDSPPPPLLSSCSCRYYPLSDCFYAWKLM